MATVRNAHSPDVTKKAGEDLSAALYKFVKLESTGKTVVLCDDITDKPYGVVQPCDPKTAGSEVVVRVVGETKIVASAALAVDVYVGTATDGEAQTAVSTQFPRGRITTPSGADQDLAVIELFNSGAALA